MHYSVEDRFSWVIRLFVCLLVFWLPYSPAVIESSVVTGLILWILKRIVTGKRRSIIPETPLNKPILLFLIVCILSASLTAFWRESLPNFLTKTLEWFIVYFLVIEAVTTRKHIYIILGIFLLTLVATALDSLVQYYVTHKDIFLGHVIEPDARATAGFKTPNGLGAYLTGAILIVLSWIFKKNERFRYRFLFLFLLSLLIWSLAVTFSRGAWLTAFLGIMFFALLYRFHRRHLEFYCTFGFLFILVVLVALFGFILTSDWDLPALRYGTAFWRLQVWADTLKMIQDRPFLGHGINTFMRIFETYRSDFGSSPTYAHNSYLQLTAETGVIGLVAFLWIFRNLFLWFLRPLAIHGIKSDSLTIPAIGVFSAIFAFLLQSFFDNQFYSLQLSAYLWFLVGLLVVMIREIRWQSSNGH